MKINNKINLSICFEVDDVMEFGLNAALVLAVYKTCHPYEKPSLNGLVYFLPFLTRQEIIDAIKKLGWEINSCEIINCK